MNTHTLLLCFCGYSIFCDYIIFFWIQVNFTHIPQSSFTERIVNGTRFPKCKWTNLIAMCKIGRTWTQQK